MGLERKLRRRAGRPERSQAETPLYMAWYSAEEYARLLEVADDREQIRDTYQNWLRGAEKALRNLPVKATVVHINVEELVTWCQAHRRPVDSAARSEYAGLMGQTRPEIPRIAADRPE